MFALFWIEFKGGQEAPPFSFKECGAVKQERHHRFLAGFNGTKFNCTALSAIFLQMRILCTRKEKNAKQAHFKAILYRWIKRIKCDTITKKEVGIYGISTGKALYH